MPPPPSVGAGLRVFVFGFNQSTIGAGAVVVFQLSIAASAPPGTLAIDISGARGTTPTAEAVGIAPGSGTVTVNMPADTTAPSISGVAAGIVAYSSATINWTTNEASDSEVEYGLTSSYGSTSGINASLVTAHSQALGGLSASTTYHYRVKSRDAAGNLAVSGDFVFATTAPPDTTAPVISGVASSGVTDQAATITWVTNEAADTQVEYGTTAAYGAATPLNSVPATAHSQALA